MTSEVHNIDCLELMRTLPDKCFQLAIADPPYGLDRKSTRGAGKLKNRTLNRYEMQWGNPRLAFSALIDKPGVGGPGTWKRNPWVFAYSFELVK